MDVIKVDLVRHKEKDAYAKRRDLYDRTRQRQIKYTTLWNSNAERKQ